MQSIRSRVIGAVAVGLALTTLVVLLSAANLWLFAGPSLAAGPTQVSLRLSPATIPADGTTTSTATATVTNPASPSDKVVIKSSDPADHVSATHVSHPGSYVATISSSNPGQSTISATDKSASPSQTKTAVLTKYGKAHSISVSLSPSVVTANGASSSTATAVVADARGDPVPNQHVVFSSSDPAEQLSATTDRGHGTYTATITSSPRAGSVTITATDTSVIPNLSASATLTQSAGSPAEISVALAPSSIVAKGTVTTRAVATVIDAHGNPITGDPVVFSSSDPAMRVDPTANNGDGMYSATLTSSTTPGGVTITATDRTTGLSGRATLTQTAVPMMTQTVTQPPVRGVVGSLLLWSFHFTPSYTTVLYLEVIRPPPGANIVLSCTGKGCPFRTRKMQVKLGSCNAGAEHCGGPPIRLEARFRHHHLRVGSRITVEVLLPGWIGKYYSFTIRARRRPRVKLDCIAPGHTRPGVGC